MAPAATVDEAVATALVALADDDLAVGHVLTSVAGFGPDLEVNIALSSMGQDELGHARAYYGLALALGPDRDAVNAAIFDRGAASFTGSDLAWVYGDAWEVLTVKHYLFETADAVRRSLLLTSTVPELAATVERMEGEERYHLDFWTVWLDRTVRRSAAGQERAQVALDLLWAPALTLFDVDAFGAIVPAAALVDAATGWQGTTAASLAELGLAVPSDTVDDAAVGDRQRIVDELQHVYRLAPGQW